MMATVGGPAHTSAVGSYPIGAVDTLYSALAHGRLGDRRPGVCPAHARTPTHAPSTQRSAHARTIARSQRVRRSQAVPGGRREAVRATHPPSFSASYANLALTQRACDATAIFGRASESHGRYLVLAAVPASLSALPPAPTHLHLAPTARRLRAAPCSRRRRRASARGGRSFVRAFISARPHLRRAARISSL